MSKHLQQIHETLDEQEIIAKQRMASEEGWGKKVENLKEEHKIYLQALEESLPYLGATARHIVERVLKGLQSTSRQISYFCESSIARLDNRLCETQVELDDTKQEYSKFKEE